MTGGRPGRRWRWRSRPVFYGWIVWLVAIVGVSASSPGQSYSVSLFMDFFIADFGLDRTTVSGLYGGGTFLASITLTWMGRRLDLSGNRRMGVAVGAAFGLSLVFCALVNGPIMLLIAFIGIRSLGQGGLTLVSTTAVANWYRRRRGAMMAYLALIYALFQGLYVNLLRLLLESVDWRSAFLMLGVGVVALVVPAFGLLMRDSPEAQGLRPDNLAEDPQPNARPSDSEAGSWRLAEAIRTPIFWVFIASRMLSSAWATGLILHQVSIFAQLQHSARIATETFALVSIFAAGSALLAGYLIDRFNPSLVVIQEMIALLAACLLCMTMRGAPMLVLYALAFGLGLGIGYVFDGAVWTNMFGRAHQGEIRGFVFTAVIFGSAVGPALFGLSYDLAGGYEPVLWMGALLSVILALLAMLTPRPRRPAAGSGSPGAAGAG